MGGTTRLLLSPHPVRRGADDLAEMPTDTRDGRLARLAAAEDLLAEAAEIARDRGSWRSRLGNFGLNLAGGGIVWAFDDLKGGLASAGVGIAVGELFTFLTPRRGTGDVEDYRRHFSGSPAGPRASWSVVPTTSGAALLVTF